MKNIKVIAMKCLVKCMQFIYAIMKILPVRDKAVFISRQTDGMPVDFRLIIDEMERRGCDWQIVVLCKRIKSTIPGVCGYGVHVMRQMFHLATAQVVLIDGYCIAVSVLRHKKSLRVIQIWHAIGCMKKFGYAMIGEEEGTSRDVAEVMKMHKNYDYALISSFSFIKDYLEGFGIEREKVLQIPLPKVDLLTSEEYLKESKKRLIEKYPVLTEKKNILYCPTFRKDESASISGIEDLIVHIDFTRYNLVYNQHPNSKVNICDPRVLILPYKTMELLSIADYVISDYSSVIYEAGLAKRPVFLYGYDWEEYSKKRAFNLDLKRDVPTLFSEEPEKIINAIEEDAFDWKKFAGFIDRNVVIPTGGCAAAIVDLILKERN